MIMMKPFAGVPLAEIYPYKGNHSTWLSCKTKEVHIGYTHKHACYKVLKGKHK